MIAALSLSLANFYCGILSAVCPEMLTAPLCPLKAHVAWLLRLIKVFYFISNQS